MPHKGGPSTGRGQALPSRAHGSSSQRAYNSDIRLEGNSTSSFNEFSEMNQTLPERFSRFSRQKRQTDLPNTFGEKFNIKVNLDIRKYVHGQDDLAKKAIAGTWEARNELPTSDEVSMGAGEEVVLERNRVKKPWKSTEQYLKTHYELMREDAVSPLRDAVDKFRLTPEMDDTNDLRVYEKVYIKGFTFGYLGVAARIQFSTARSGRKILWGSSKRLIAGTIVALSPAEDKFKDQCAVAVVAARPISGVEASPPEIDIYFSRPEEMQVDPQQEFIMVEAATGYYEAHRYTLQAVQKLAHESFPLSSHICFLSPDIETPSYLTKKPNLNLSAAANPDADISNMKSLNVVNAWPAPRNVSLDTTQWEALQQILTKNLSIIQGPPGTGKTHVSKIALRILVENRSDDDPPIIIAAQTNHALDQLLMHVSVFEPDFIRLGGRSTEPEVKKRALYQVREQERIPFIPGGLLSKTTSLVVEQTKKLLDVLKPLIRCEDKSLPFSVDDLFALGILNDAQRKSLEAGAALWVSADEEAGGPMQMWLNRSIIPFEITCQAEKYFAEEEAEEDLEFEQLREAEAETGVVDEEDIEALKGRWCSIRDPFTIHHCTDSDIGKAKYMLDTLNDLWKVPDQLRGPMYLIMQQKLKTAVLVKFREETAVYNRLLKDMKIGRWERDAAYLERTKIIGMTTTGLSKYRALISSLKPKIILIEEAAEVIEAPVTVACVESLEHLILVGDHQQLQGHCSVQDLEGHPFYLNVSLFERLVSNKMPFKTLLRQRRMEPEFRQLISSLYPELQDHQSVLRRKFQPLGLADGIKSFFFSHEWSEYRDSQQSLYNEEEARFVAGFYRHLIKNEISAQDITILTFYNGQRKRILRELRKDPEIAQLYNNVKTVDSYQGEENEVVILSLVRSNDKAQIGFLETDNRVCVALSRARHGFFIFGNSRLLSGVTDLWADVVQQMDSRNRLSNVMPTKCRRHGNNELIQYPDDWEGREGGCTQLCNQELECGHVCQLKCHRYEHDKVFCTQKCHQKLKCGHVCVKKCFELCACDCTDQADDLSMTPPGSGNGTQFHPNLDERNGWNDGWSTSQYPQNVQNNDHTGGAGYFHGTGWTTYDTRAPSNHYAQRPASTFKHAMHRVKVSDGRGSQTSSHQRSDSRHNSSTAERGPSEVQSRNSFRLSPERQEEKVSGWSSYAKGGVEADDAAREAAHLMKRDKSVAKEAQLVDLSSPDGNPITNEKVNVMGDGRLRVTHDFLPAHYGGDAATKSAAQEASRPVSRDAELDGLNLLD